MIVYSRTSCAPCQTLKKYLEMIGAVYIVKDVDEPENYKELQKYALTVPVVVKGDKYVVGLKYGEIKELALS